MLVGRWFILQYCICKFSKLWKFLYLATLWEITFPETPFHWRFWWTSGCWSWVLWEQFSCGSAVSISWNINVLLDVCVGGMVFYQSWRWIIAFPCLQELHLDVLLKYQDQHRGLLGLLNLSNFLKQSFMQFCRYVLTAYCLVFLTEYTWQCRLLVLTNLRLLYNIPPDDYPIITFFGDYYQHCKHWNNGENL